MATYEMMKRTIIRQKASGALNRSDWQSKLDVFMLFDRITPEQYTELKEVHKLLCQFTSFLSVYSHSGSVGGAACLLTQGLCTAPARFYASGAAGRICRKNIIPI